MSSCASVKLIPEKAVTIVSKAPATGQSERLALVAATEELDETPWPAVNETSLTERMASRLFGRKADDRGLSRDEAVDLYAESLSSRSADPAHLLLADADRTLRSARDVAEAGRLAAEAINPDTDDIAVLEDAIAEVRFSRDMYLATLKSLKDDGHGVSNTQMAGIKAAFSQTIDDIGTTADVVAARAMSANQASQLAASPEDDTAPRAD